MKIAVGVLGILTPALHELAGIILVLALSLITATAFASKSPLRKMWLIAWTATRVGFLIVFVAPGNAIRMGTIPNRGNPSTVIHEVLSAINQYILPWCLDFRHWLLAVLLWVDPRVASLRERLSGLSSFRAISVFLLSWISLIVIAIGPAVWNLGSPPPGRTMNMIYGMFLMGWIALAFLVMRPHPSVSIQPAYRAVSLARSLAPALRAGCYQPQYASERWRPSRRPCQSVAGGNGSAIRRVEIRRPKCGDSRASNFGIRERKHFRRGRYL